jgi:hypothetical protein
VWVARRRSCWLQARLPKLRELRYASGVQRREHSRYRLWFPVQLAAGERVKIGMNHNIGAGGMLLASASELVPGEAVQVTFQLPPAGEPRTLQGHVLRVEPNSEDPEGGWPHRVAIAFDEIVPELHPFLEEAIARFG